MYSSITQNIKSNEDVLRIMKKYTKPEYLEIAYFNPI